MNEKLTVQQLERLHADLHPSRVAQRAGGGGAQLSYLEAYDVRATLIRIFGYGGFSAETIDTRIVHESTYAAPNNADRLLWRIAVVCTFRLTIHQTGAVYTESAAASQSGPDYGEVLDFAIKTAESDALKRAATNLGTTFGLSLYRNGSTQDVVSRVFAPAQYDVVQDLVAARGGDQEAAAAARQRMQARLKTHASADADTSAVATGQGGDPEGAGQSTPTEAASPAAHDTVPPAAEQDTPVNPVQKAAEDLTKVTRTKSTRTPRAGSLAVVS